MAVGGGSERRGAAMLQRRGRGGKGKGRGRGGGARVPVVEGGVGGRTCYIRCLVSVHPHQKLFQKISLAVTSFARSPVAL